MNEKKKIRKALFVLILSGLSVYLGNLGLEKALSLGNTWYEAGAYILLAGIGICLFGIYLPFRMASRWELPYAYWPKNKNPIHVIFFLALWFVLMNYDNLTLIKLNGLNWGVFLEHLSQTLLIQVVYYPLFAMLLFPAFRERYGLWWSLFINGVLFTLYHALFPALFPEIVHSYTAGYLFITFIAYMLLYIWSESLILVMIVHILSNALFLASKDVLFESTGLLVLIPVLLAVGTLVAMIIGAYRQKSAPIKKPEFWITMNLKD
ncbi:MAG: hypothetical protein DRP86_01590 [Candidatus Neomarinimicrobiota bacterium]|nr:hypothetical protein [Candidatus Neomarinimicrobiota bacterium]RKY51354.1 MAG: hypothetical protein DRP86_01590 [Candidatus Neomarinimicrobiota bacterium]